MNTIDDRNIKRGLIFLHIPKAAGTTLNQFIMDLYPKEAVYKIDGNRVNDSITELKQRFEREGDSTRIRCVIGHMPFGLHSFMPMETDYITVLRDPVERVISHYYFVRRRPSHYLHDRVVSGNMDIKEYVESGISTELSNGQARLLSGMEEELKGVYGDSSAMDKALELAKSNLKEHFVGVGLSERFGDSLVLFAKIFGWKKLEYEKRNVSASRPLKEELPADALKTIERYNRLDMELYEFAERIFKDMLFQYRVRKSRKWFFQAFNPLVC